MHQAASPGVPVDHRHARILWMSVAVIVLSIFVHLGGRVHNTTLGSDPKWLIAASPSIDHTLVAATQLAFQPFFTISFFRRLIIDPFWYLVGRIGIEGLKESRIQFFREFAADVENRSIAPAKKRWEPHWVHSRRDWAHRFFQERQSVVRFILVWHFFTADGVTSFLLGKNKVSPAKWIPINLVGTALTVCLFFGWREDVRPYIATIQIISTIVTILVVGGATIRYRESIAQSVRFTYNYTMTRRWVQHLVCTYTLWRHA